MNIKPNTRFWATDETKSAGNTSQYYDTSKIDKTKLTKVPGGDDYYDKNTGFVYSDDGKGGKELTGKLKDRNDTSKGTDYYSDNEVDKANGYAEDEPADIKDKVTASDGTTDTGQTADDNSNNTDDWEKNNPAT